MVKQSRIHLHHCDLSPMRWVVAVAEQIAIADAHALVAGETGVGKRALAGHIHDRGPRAGKAIVEVRCEGASEEALRRALFGDGRDLHYRGGLFGAAQGSTLLLDEVGNLSPSLQATLMNALVMTGSADPLSARCVRVIATTSRSLHTFALAQHLRRDLLDLFAFRVVIPPVRDRRGDAVAIVRACWNQVAGDRELTAAALDAVLRQEWYGNVREIEAFVVRLSAVPRGAAIGLEDVKQALNPLPLTDPARPLHTHDHKAVPCLDRDEIVKHIQTNGIHSFLEWIETSLIAWALDQTGGSRKAAADLLGMKRTTLVEKLRRRASHLQLASDPPLLEH